MAHSITTRLLFLLDTHGTDFDCANSSCQRVDVSLLCGDLMGGSKLEGFRTTLEMLKRINAPLKSVIEETASDHESTAGISKPSDLTAVDNENSLVIEKSAGLRASALDSAELAQAKRSKLEMLSCKRMMFRDELVPVTNRSPKGASMAYQSRIGKDGHAGR
ncbi:hypothetical protein AYO22_11590 [Fonsecaea multimorphosa]|nr:hypothetical protein AYO22_11590 [Fonsecaea multimorphosa]